MTADHGALVASGQWREFRARFRADEEALRTARRWPELVRLQALEMSIAARCGAFDHQRYDELRWQALTLGEQESADTLDHAAGLSHLTAGNPAEAWRVLRSLATVAASRAARRAYVDLVQAALAADETRAVRWLLAAGPRLVSPAAPMTTARLWHARGLCAAQSGADDAAALFERALGSPEMACRPMEHARLLLDYGRLLRAQRRDEARAPLREALTRFEWLTATPWAAQARAELRALGVRVPGEPAQPAIEALSPHKLRILRLAAEGLSNRDIGERLSISPRTVGSHLYRSYPLVGVRCRGELGRLFAGTATGDGAGGATGSGGLTAARPHNGRYPGPSV
ncbi:LuxR C-terminal-related transcriptional regulator [Streptomyces sp. NPDC058457]|uniref:LuxR C-terminal-related transcriptional regulator n=1 Tax=Streptomyces sp. NPDC058457 TaxID=3346507 RepID=UPI003654DFDE